MMVVLLSSSKRIRWISACVYFSIWSNIHRQHSFSFAVPRETMRNRAGRMPSNTCLRSSMSRLSSRMAIISRSSSSSTGIDWNGGDVKGGDKGGDDEVNAIDVNGSNTNSVDGFVDDAIGKDEDGKDEDDKDGIGKEANADDEVSLGFRRDFFFDRMGVSSTNPSSSKVEK